MHNFEIIKGNLIDKALSGEFDVVCHGANCFGIMGAGVAKQFKEKLKAHRADSFTGVHGDIHRLGTISYLHLALEDGIHTKKYDTELSRLGFIPFSVKQVVVVNAYTQFNLGANLDYEALTVCMRKINHEFRGSHIGLPGWIGCGIAGGDKIKVEQILRQELKDCDVTICEL
jgi:O-acetyl-ADP-ribose deacetylase (regulator of RNase III)